eukprot:CAMPEP_0113444916 /NCGR_PEP_ID=MMETSP0014_2-20120614/2916_1 /TAXON_ID=2857 /ORGANISM="Nitzschia sp." /LENGTH=758 /DNA_ID=CAMNT_0000335949 /DNA_START=55 /DNA_END=2331 /DNA_ORIENTATION=+ /assembly_acc=CAM_ASM_000159
MAEEIDSLALQALEKGLDLDEGIVSFFKASKDPAAAQRLKKYIDNLAQAEAARKISMETVWGKDSDTFKQPKLRFNRDVLPSNRPKQETINQKPAASNEPEQRKNEEENKKPKVSVTRKAQIKTLSNNNWVNICDVKIPTRKRDGSLLFSDLGIEWNDAQVANVDLEYANETRIQYLCVNMIKDVFRCIGLLPDEVTALMEISIYTMRPDIILVLRRQGKIFFVIEVKSPELEEGAVFQNQNVAGQISSYLLAVRAMGDPCPMGAIMTFNKIALVTLGDYSENESFAKAMSQSKELLSSDGGLPLESTSRGEQTCASRDATPIKTIRFVQDQKTSADVKHERLTLLQSESKNIDGDDNRDDDEDEVVNMEAHISEVKKDGDVFPFLLQAILVAYLKGTEVTDVVAGIGDDEDLGQRLAFKISAESFSWVHIRQGLNSLIKYDVTAEDNDRFNILGKLGEGRTGAVYLVANASSGFIYALKSYYLPRSKTGSQDEQQQIWNETTKIAEDEASRWKILYEGRGFNAAAMPLGNFPCSLMPYGGDIRCHGSESNKWIARFNKIAEIKTELVRIAIIGYEYEKHDLRWSHVVVDKDGKIFFCDLGSLITVDENCHLSPEDRAYKQLEILLKPWSKFFFPESSSNRTDLSREKCRDIIRKNDVLMQLLPANQSVETTLSELIPDENATDDPKDTATIKVCRWAIQWFLWQYSEANDEPDSPSSNGGLSGTSSKENVHAMDDGTIEGSTRVGNNSNNKKRKHGE